MCSCVNIAVGSYGNQVELPRPKHMIGMIEGSSSDTICIDACLSDEISNLWASGIATTGCCCGHNKQTPFIGVIPSHEAKMKKLGYQLQHNPMRPNDGDTFNPISII